MENYQYKLVDVLIRGPLLPPLEGSIHVKPNDMDVYSGFFNPLMCKVSAAAEQGDLGTLIL